MTQPSEAYTGTLLQDLSDRVRFTEIEWTVAQYIANNLEDISVMNIGKLAEKTYTSNGTVLRVCRKLGCHGFRDLKLRCFQQVEAQKYLKTSVDFTKPFDLWNSIGAITNQMASLYKESIDILQSSIEPIVLQKAVETMLQSKRIFIFAIGDSQLTAESFINKLSKIDIFPVLASSTGQEVHVAQSLRDGDCAIFISYSGTSPVCKKSLPLLKNKQAKIIGLTSNKSSLLAQNSDCCILIPRMEKDEKIAIFYSQLAFRYLLDILYSLLYAQKERNQRREAWAKETWR